MKYIAYTSANSPSLLRKTLAVVTTLAAAAVALMFSAAVLAVVGVIAVVGMAVLWWKTRDLRKHMRNRRTAANDAGPFRDPAFRGEAFEGDASRGEIIEGEVIHVHESREENRRE